MKHLLTYIMCISILSQGYSQFFETIDYNNNQIGWDILTYEDRIFVTSGEICNGSDECSAVYEIDREGNVLWRKSLEWLDMARLTGFIRDGRLFVSGNNDKTQAEWFLHEMSLDGGDSIATWSITDPVIEYERMFNIVTMDYAGKTLVMGSGADTIARHAIMFILDEEGNQDSTIIIQETDLHATPWDAKVDNEGNLVVFVRDRRIISGERRQRIIKYNENLDAIWTFAMETDRELFVPRGTILEDNSIILLNEFDSSVREQLFRISEDGTSELFFTPPNGVMNVDISSVHTAQNGDILLTGSYSNGFEAPTFPLVQDIPYMSRISSEGELLWWKSYSTLDSEGEFHSGGLFNVKELADGTLMAVGRLRNTDYSNVLLVYTDENGCIIADDCNFINPITSTTVVDNTRLDITISPNPSYDYIYLGPSAEGLSYSIYDMSGHEQSYGIYVDTEGVDISGMTQGMYVIKVRDEKGRVAVERFVKL